MDRRSDHPAGGTVHVVDDDRAVLKSSRALLESVGLRPITYDNPEQFLAGIGPEMSGCVVLDVRMPVMSGLELFKEAVRRGMDLPVLFITGYGEVPCAVDAMKLGAVDFMEKPVDHTEFIDKIRAALAQGGAERVQRQQCHEVKTRLAALTPRESEILDLVLEGKPSKAIAEELGISPKTVEIHRSSILKKMKVKNAVELARLISEARLHPEDRNGA